jgi:hypothetical protein
VVKLSKQDRQAVRTAPELEQKYQFGKQFAEVMGIATDARDKVNSVESALRAGIEELETSITRDTEKIILSALAAYAKKDDLTDVKTSLETSFGVRAEGIEGRVTKTETSIEKVDGDLQEKFNTITKYFTFDVNGMTIGQVDNPNKVVIDNDDITIYVKGSPIQEFKADGTATIPSLKITTALSLLGLVIEEDETHINCGYVG